jgi:ribosomal protein S18 acetylase RimI-like enzyme
MPIREIAIEVLDADLDDAQHAAGILAALDSYARDPIGGGRPLAPEVRERLIPELRAQGNARILLAFESGRPIGVAVCFIGFSTFAARPLLNIHDLAVLPECQGRGVGRALLANAESRAREIGCCKLTLEVRRDNDRAHALYERFGFRDFSPGADPTPTLFLQKGL